MMRSVLILLAVFVALTAALPAAAEQGGATISAAPFLVWGQTQTGVGGNNTAATQQWGYGGQTFWRLQLYRGDEVRGNVHVQTRNGCASDRMELFGPSVTDGNLADAQPLISRGTIFQNSCAALTFKWRWVNIPITGRATLWAAISSEAPTFSFVATVRHATATRLLPAVRSDARVRLRAKVSALAGHPIGVCVFRIRSGIGAWRAAGTSPLETNGTCTATGRAPRGVAIASSVSFRAGSGWLPSSATTS